MPRKRRAGKVQRQALDSGLWRYLCDLPEPGDAENAAVRGFHYLAEPWPEEEAWALYGDDATAAHATIRPGCRPTLWWRFSAPGAPHAHRMILAGSGWPAACQPVRGIPLLVGDNPADPPVIEAEAAFLRRHGVLLPGEARRLSAKDYEPEVLAVGLDLEDGEA